MSGHSRGDGGWTRAGVSELGGADCTLKVELTRLTAERGHERERGHSCVLGSLGH